MEIRKATREDTGILSQMNVDVQVMHAEAQPRLFKQPDGDDFAVPFFSELFDNPNVVIYLAEDECPLGYVVLRVVRREENPFMHAWNFVYVDQISVQPEYQGRGIGKALMARTEELAREEGLDFIGLDSWDFNTEAHAFFYSLGFEVFNLRMRRWVEG